MTDESRVRPELQPLTPKQQAFDSVLDEIEDYLEQRQDVRDGSDGPRPNEEMSLLSDLRWWRTPMPVRSASTERDVIQRMTPADPAQNSAGKEQALYAAQGKSSIALPSNPQTGGESASSPKRDEKA